HAWLASMRPRFTASSTSNAGTIVPAADISHLRRPPDISSIILASSTAEMCSRFVAGHALCTFQTMRCCAEADPGPRHRTAARISTGRAKAIQTRTSLLGLMELLRFWRPLDLHRLHAHFPKRKGGNKSEMD